MWIEKNSVNIMTAMFCDFILFYAEKSSQETTIPDENIDSFKLT